MDVDLTIMAFKNRLKALGYAGSTIRAYGNNLGSFARYLQERDIRDIRQVTREVILEYREKVMDEPICMESKALKIRPVKRLFESLTLSHRLLINPAEGIVETCRKNRRIGTVLSLEEMKKLLSQPNLSLRTQIRDRALMEVLYSTGIRLNELLSLEVYHVDLRDRVLFIRRGKGKKQRVVPLGKTAATYLREYMEKVRPYHARKNPKERRLFLNHSALPLSPEAVRQAMRQYRKEAGIKKPVSPHTLRRTCATHLLQQGADLRYIQKLLGHSSLKVTKDYTRVMPVEVKQTHNKTHPNSRRRHNED
jgi:integrase/recombinase XerD